MVVAVLLTIETPEHGCSQLAVARAFHALHETVYRRFHPKPLFLGRHHGRIAQARPQFPVQCSPHLRIETAADPTDARERAAGLAGDDQAAEVVLALRDETDDDARDG